MKILTLCGSLRPDSSNRALLDLAQTMRPEYSWDSAEIESLPFFRPENQYDNTPEVALSLRAQAAQADLILISTPEYAHGIPGVLKNALEWVFFEGTMGKKVVVLISSGQGEHVRDQLVEVLKTMDFKIRPEQCLVVRGGRARLSDSSLQTEIDQFLRVNLTHD